MLDVMITKGPIDPGLHVTAGIEWHRQRLPCQQTAQPFNPAPQRLLLYKYAISTILFNRGYVGPVRWIIDKRCQVDIEILAQVVQQVKRTDLTSLVRGIRYAVAQKQ